MIAKLLTNRVRRTYLGGGRINAFCGVSGRAASTMPPYPGHDGGFVETALPEMPRPEDWIASTVQAFNGTDEIDGEGLGRIEDGRLVKDVVGALPILVKLLDSDERLVIQAHPTVPCAKRLFNSCVGKTECWYFLPGTSPDACVHLGFKPGVTRTAWEQAVLDFSHKSTRSTCSTRLNISPVTQICGPELTDKFGMWRVLDGGRVALPRDRAVAHDDPSAVRRHRRSRVRRARRAHA